MKLELRNFSDDNKIFNRLQGNNMVLILHERKSTR